MLILFKNDVVNEYFNRHNEAMKIHFFVLFLCLTQGLSVFSASIIMSEDNLKNFIEQGVVEFDKLENLWKDDLLRYEQHQDQKTPSVFTGISQERTNRKPIIKFAPVASPVTRSVVGLKQKTHLGIEWTAQLASEMNTFSLDGAHFNISTIVAELLASVNLWQNFKGELDKMDKLGFEGSAKATELKIQVQKHALYMQLKKSYYDLIINSMALQLAKSRYEQAVKQTQYAQHKLSLSATDESEVDRFMAQQASRQQAIHQIELQKEGILLGIKNVFHQFNVPQTSIELAPYDFSTKQNVVLACLKQITMHKEAPQQYSHLGAIKNELLKSYDAKTKRAQVYQEMDLSLDFAIRTNGVRKNYFDTYEDAFGNNRLGFKLGLNLTIPLPDNDRSKKILLTKIQTEKALTSKSADLQLMSLHDYAKNSLAILWKNVESAGQMTKALEKRVRAQQIKFEQGRVSANDFIQDQDALLESQYSALSNQQAIIQGLVTYLQTYHLFPCEFNK